MDCFCSFHHVLVPIVHILFGSSELIPQAHTHHISDPIEKCCHLGQTQQPQIWVKKSVTEKPIPVRITATPPWLCYVVVQYHHHILVSKTFHHRLKSLDERKVNDGGVVGLDAGDGIKEAEVLKGASNGERSQRVVCDQKYGPSESDTVEAHRLYSLGNVIDGLFAEPFSHHSFHVGNPIHTRELYPSPILAHDPSRIRAEGESRRCHGPNINYASSSSGEEYY
ncbi:hypothetical protein V8G54_000998 [Vigna mungo]|uniref:Uncharacterized protein n=1 Tax=Vigna mungo TaxID=3915 RepID=A0AAQ3P6W2_VIGMU